MSTDTQAGGRRADAEGTASRGKTRGRRRAVGRRRIALVVAAVLLVGAGVVGGPYLYARFLAPEPPAPLGAVAEDAPVAEPVTGAFDADGTWEVTAGSEAGYRLDEVLSGRPVTVVGRTDQVTGTLTVEDDVLVAADVVVDVASIATDEAARDAYFRRALRVSSVPEARFTLTEPVDVTELTEEGRLTVDAVGTLTLRDVTQPVTASLQARRTSDGVEVVGSIPVVLADHDLTAPDLGFVTVEPEGLVEMRLLLRR